MTFTKKIRKFSYLPETITSDVQSSHSWGLALPMHLSSKKKYRKQHRKLDRFALPKSRKSFLTKGRSYLRGRIDEIEQDTDDSDKKLTEGAQAWKEYNYIRRGIEN